ncbi:alpha-glucosidase (family GH31 glycosyl hydrolase) [Bacteroides reticulotermitis]|uniref:Alpha-glucosidase (Family GH31 glycosyl hydrolase) n=1 Tax=Bacteroides reticulotermitis TaxID=1133319 RepID=A0A840D1C5_9BACE|nr:glycoside hydrolase family 31 protein [Bacteroides reticulotermitis]MBB4044188.1 alpha-glucosidase (family GH31 glycosyl hydrolase) [Bacteroides reticulotermitis]
MKKKLLFLLCILQGVLSVSQAQNTQRNIAYTDANVRFSVISDGVLRLEYAPDGVFVDDASHLAVNRLYPQATYQLKTSGGWIEIATPKMKMRYKKNSGQFTDRNLVITAAKGASPFTWKPGIQQKGNLKGTYRTLDGMDGDTQSQTWVADTKQGEKLKLEDGLLATDGWTFIDDSKGLLFDNDPDWNWVKERPANGGQDWYFMTYGRDYKAALKDYTLFSGKVPLPPRYAFGYWWSRYWLYSDKEFRNLIDNFHTYQIPLDVLVVDMDWHYTEKGKGGWTGWTWNRDLFPNPKQFLGYLKDNKVKVTLNLHPADGVASYEENYSGLAADMGIDPQSKQTIPWINSDKKFMQKMFKHILTLMEKDGVDFWWLDWQQGIYDPKVKNLSNTWWINYSFFTQMEQHRETRPMLYHRWGGLGNHRYQVGFSGDAVVSWKSLDFQPYFNATASNVLYGYWSHDLGGHIGSKIDPEMYTRWLQFGALTPIMRTHSQKSAGLNKEPWVFNKEYGDILRKTIRQRYEMAPYIYTMARKGYDEGLSLCRPMYYDYPDSREAYDFRSEYMFGDDMLIAPATAPVKDGYLQMHVWLPEGEWYEWHTGTLLTGGQVVERPFAIDEYPIYVKAGAVLPLYTEKVMNLSGNDEDVVVTVFPGGKDSSSFTLYEDNGNDKKYASEYALTKLTSSRQGQEQTVVIGRREGQYADMPSSRSFKVKLLSSLVPQSVTVNGHPAKYVYSGEEFALVIDLPAMPCNQEKVVKVVYPTETVQLNGVLGVSNRIAKSMELLKYRDSYICFKEEFGKMGSLHEAVSYAPAELPTLLAEFWKSYNDLPEVLKRQGLNEANAKWFLQSVGWTAK